jgi:hypothetical protein
VPGLVIAVALEVNVSDMLRSVIACPPREYLHTVGHAEEKNTEEDECLMVVDAAVGVGAMERASKFTVLFTCRGWGHCSSARLLPISAIWQQSCVHARQETQSGVRYGNMGCAAEMRIERGMGGDRLMMGREVWGAVPVRCAHACNH